MKHATLILASCLGYLACPLAIHSAGPPAVATLQVFKLDGTRHCDPYPGDSPEAMALELTTAGIACFSWRKGFDGREGIASCGAPTGQINIYEIAFADLSAALGLGFKKLPENLTRPDPVNRSGPERTAVMAGRQAAAPNLKLQEA